MLVPHWTGVQQCVKAMDMPKPIPESRFVCLSRQHSWYQVLYLSGSSPEEKNPPSVINIGNSLKGARDRKRLKGNNTEGHR